MHVTLHKLSYKHNLPEYASHIRSHMRQTTNRRHFELTRILLEVGEELPSPVVAVGYFLDNYSTLCVT